MKKFKNRSSVSVTARVWVSPTGHRIAWRAATTPFDSFVGQVQAYARQNGIAEPSIEQLEDLMCSQSPSRDCTDDPNYHLPDVARHTWTQEVVSGGGCSACGKKR